MKRCIAVLTGLVVASSLSAADNPLVEGNNRFALDLYGKLRQKDGNVFCSPYSLSTALGMTYAGARGETAKEMASALHFTPADEKLHPAFAGLIKEINGDGKKRDYQLKTANALWGQKDYPFVPAFLKLTKDNYGAGLNEVDFKDDTEGARKTINTWAEKETEGKIKEVLKPGTLSDSTRLVLTNAIYFKGNWHSQFKKASTEEQPFHVAAEKVVKVPMMRQKFPFAYAEDEELQAVELPYQGKDLAMLVLLPKKRHGLGEVEKTLTAEKVRAVVGRLGERDVEVSLPKFQLTAEMSLNEILDDLGMRQAFRPKEADFSGLNGGAEPLFISRVIQKAFVDVNEEGTEAAAVTAVVVDPRSSKPEAAVVKADHPFVYLIRDRRNGSILFLGRFAAPPS